MFHPEFLLNPLGAAMEACKDAVKASTISKFMRADFKLGEWATHRETGYTGQIVSCGQNEWITLRVQINPDHVKDFYFTKSGLTHVLTPEFFPGDKVSTPLGFRGVVKKVDMSNPKRYGYVLQLLEPEINPNKLHTYYAPDHRFEVGDKVTSRNQGHLCLGMGLEMTIKGIEGGRAVCVDKLNNTRGFYLCDLLPIRKPSVWVDPVLLEAPALGNDWAYIPDNEPEPAWDKVVEIKDQSPEGRIWVSWPGDGTMVVTQDISSDNNQCNAHYLVPGVQLHHPFRASYEPGTRTWRGYVKRVAPGVAHFPRFAGTKILVHGKQMTAPKVQKLPNTGLYTIESVAGKHADYVVTKETRDGVDRVFTAARELYCEFIEQGRGMPEQIWLGPEEYEFVRKAMEYLPMVYLTPPDKDQVWSDGDRIMGLKIKKMKGPGVGVGLPSSGLFRRLV